MVYFLFLLFMNVVFLASPKHICTFNHTVNLQPDEIVFIESPDFPRLMSQDEQTNCDYNFTIENTEEMNRRFWLVFTNCIPVSFCDTEMHENITSYYFNGTQFKSFQGYVIYDDWLNDCPLESISRVDPFHFSDETQIILFDSSSVSFNPSCLWQFTAPFGYGFKFVTVRWPNLDSLTPLNITVETKNYTYLTHKKVKENTAYYIPENNLKITLSSKISTNPKFKIYVTIIKILPIIIDGNCTITKDEKITTWSNYDKIRGYQNNARCEFNNVVKAGTEQLVTKQEYAFESHADQINLYFDGSSSIPLTFAFQKSLYPFILYPSEDEKNGDRNVICEFLSDGSFQSLGFEITFEERICECAKEVMTAPCEGKNNFYIMNSDDPYYCGNLDCTFTIELNSSCNKKERFITLEMSMDTFDLTFDVFKVISNNKTRAESSYRDLIDGSLIFSSLSETFFQAITVTSNNYREFTVELSSFEKPSPEPAITLTKDTPYYLLNLCTKNKDNSIFDIQLSLELIKENATIDFYATYYKEHSVYFYSNSSMTKEIFFPNCFNQNDMLKVSCNTQKSSFAMFQHGTHYPCNENFYYNGGFPPSYFFHSSSYSKNCVFKNSIHEIKSYDPERVAVSSMANSNGICKFFLIVGDGRILRNIWTTPTSTGIINMYAGREGKKIASFKVEESSFWHDIKLNSYFYIFDIPQNTAVLLTIEAESYQNYFPVIPSFPYFSIFTSPLYGEGKSLPANSEGDPTPLFTYYINEYVVRITLEDYNVTSHQMQYFLFVDDKIINITEDFKSQIFSHVTVEINYACIDDCISVHNLLLKIESLDNPHSSTPTLTSPKSTTVTTSFLPTAIIETSPSLINCVNKYVLYFSILFLKLCLSA